MSITIPRRKLGRYGLEVSAIGLGCMGMSDFYGPSDEATNLNVLNAALDIGINFLDTADMYGVGANERLLGKVLKARRNQVVLATKFGIVRAPDGASLGINGTPAYVRAACDASLERLGVDHIDLYYQHRVDPTVALDEHHSRRPPSAPHCRAAIRVLAVDARLGSSDSACVRGTRHWGRRL